ncbi:MAG: aminomethyl-transferring glycine dehydrogenase subunit GcvPB [Pseudomonadales bacterium]
MTIFDQSKPGRIARAQMPAPKSADDIPDNFRRKEPAMLPEVSELQVVRHFTNVSQKNFSIDTQFYPLGSCTMKYNPRGAHAAASHAGFTGRHPLAPLEFSQGLLSCLFELQEILKEVTGMQGVSLTPMAGAQGEFAGIAMIRAYHTDRGDTERDEILVPTAAHGTNPASAVMCGYKVREVELLADGDVDMASLNAAVGPHTAGLMLTNPSTCGVFERRIGEISALVHEAGGLLYYDGANLNAILGRVKPGDMGFDVLHLNLHKTFATPHGGGGPGAGPVGVGQRLLPYLPVPIVERVGVDTQEHAEDTPEGVEDTRCVYRWLDEPDRPKTIGRLSTFMGNAGILLRAFVYARMLGNEGMRRVGDYATLNANYLAKRLHDAGFQLAYPERRPTHEFIISFADDTKRFGVTAMDIAKRLLDHGIHAPTTYFPLLIPECFLIEPTETETKDELDAMVTALISIQHEVESTPEVVKSAPHTLPVKRLDEVRAARQPDLRWTRKV